MRIEIAILAWLISATSAAHAQPTAASCELLVSRFERAEKTPDAAGQLRECSRRFPQAASPHLSLGRLLAESGDLSSAVGEFELAERLSRRNPIAPARLGMALAGLKKYQQALAAFQRATALSPKDQFLQFEVFRMQLALKRSVAANVTAKRIVDLDAAPAGLNRLAELLVEAEDYRGAAVYLDRVLAISPSDRAARYNLGLAYMKGGDARRAVDVLTLLRQHPPDPEIENLLGAAFEKLGQFVEAAQAFQKAAELAPAREDYRFDYVLELLRHNTFAGAAAVAAPSVGDFPASLRIRLALGLAFLGGKEYTKAYSHMLETVKSFPHSELALRMLVGATEASQTKTDEAEGLVRAYLESHQGQFMPHYLLGLMRMMDGDAAAAEPLLARGAALAPGHAETQLEWGKALSQSERQQAAADRYRRATQLKPDLAEAWFRLSNILRELGRTEEARAAATKFRSLSAKETEQKSVTAFLIELR